MGKVLWGNTRFQLFLGGRRRGKTMLGAMWIILEVLKGGDRTGWWVAPYYRLTERGRDAVMRILRPVWQDLQCEERKASRTIVLRHPRGTGRIVFLSADNPDTLIGEGVHAVVFDDPARIRPSQVSAVWWQSVRPCLSDTNGRALFITTPKHDEQGGGNLFEVIYRECEKGSPDYVMYHSPSWEGKWIAPEEIERARLELPSLVFRQEYGAEYIKQQSICFQIDKFQYYSSLPKGLEVYFGCDLAISKKQTADYFVVAVIGVDRREHKIYIIEMYRNRISFAQQQQVILTLADKYKPLKIFIESVAYQEVLSQELRRNSWYNVVSIYPERDKVTRALAFMGAVEAGRVYLPEENYQNAYWIKNLLDELIDFPCGLHDDQVDALVYAYKGACQQLPDYTGEELISVVKFPEI
jgi:predicted phage terminase large subunit-like protein